MSRRFSVVALGLFLGACHGGGDGGGAAPASSMMPPPGAPPVCGDAVLKVESTQSEKPHAFAASATPTFTVDLTSAQSADRTVLTVRSCATGAAAETTSVAGANGFVVDPAFYSKYAAGGCMRIAATAMKGAVAVASARAVVRYGDYSIHGSVDLANGKIDEVELDLQIDDAHFPFVVVGDGTFDITHLPAGRVVRVTAAQKGTATRPTLAGSLAPLATLDAAHASAEIHVPLRVVPSAVDAFEPDGDATLAMARAAGPLAAGLAEQHSLNNKADLDFVPLTVLAGSTYRVKLASIGARPGDFALVVSDAGGAVLAHANDTPTSFTASPAVTFTAASDGVVFAKVSRNDDEPVAAAYSINFARIATSP